MRRKAKFVMNASLFEHLGFKKYPFLTRKQRFLELAIIVLFFFVFFVTIALNNISPFNYVNIGIYFIQIVLITLWSLRYGKFSINYYLVIIVALNLLIFLSGLINNGTPLFYSTMITLPISSFFFSLFMKNERNRDRVLTMFSLSFVAFLAMFTIVYFQEIIDMEVTRIGVFFADQNLLGYIFVYGFIVILDSSLRHRVFPMLIICAYTFFLIFTTGSRSALLICIVVSIVYVFKYFGKKRSFLVFLSIVFVVVIFSILLALPAFSDFRDRIFATLSEIFLGYGGDDSTTLRIQYIVDGIEFSVRRLIFGYGSNNAALIMSRLGQSTHNNFLDMTLNYGVIFTTIFEGLLIFFIVKLNKNKSKHSNMLFSIALAIFIVQFFFPNYWTKPEYLFFPFMVGILFDYGPQLIVNISKNKIAFDFIPFRDATNNLNINQTPSLESDVSTRHKYLIILTYCYPYNPPREIFLHSEVPYLASRFDKIILIPTSRLEILTPKYDSAANNITVLNIKRNFVLNEMVIGFFVRGLFHPPFWIDLFRVLIKSRQRKNDLLTVYQHYLKNGYLLTKINRSLSDGGYYKQGNDFLIYSYWLNSNTLLGTMIADRLEIQGLKAKVIARAHGLDDLYVSYRPGIAIINKKLDSIYPISEIGLNYLFKSGIRPKAAAVSRLGVIKRNIHLDAEKDAHIRFISCSMLSKNKRVDLIIEALALIGDFIIEWTHFGDGEEMANLTSLCKSKLGKNIKWNFAGNVDNSRIIEYYLEKRPRCIINTSIIEGIPVSIMEAFSCAVPAIAPDIGALSEIIKDQVNGYLLPSGFTVNDLAESLSKMCVIDGVRILEFRKAALKTWGDLYSAERNYESFANNCEKVIK